MTKIYGYDTNIYETSIGNIKCFNESCSEEDIEKAMTNKSFFEIVIEEKDKQIKQLQSNWNSLREWIAKDVKDDFFTVIRVKDLLDKMNELEGGDNG